LIKVTQDIKVSLEFKLAEDVTEEEKDYVISREGFDRQLEKIKDAFYELLEAQELEGLTISVDKLEIIVGDEND